MTKINSSCCQIVICFFISAFFFLETRAGSGVAVTYQKPLPPGWEESNKDSYNENFEKCQFPDLHTILTLRKEIAWQDGETAWDMLCIGYLTRFPDTSSAKSTCYIPFPKGYSLGNRMISGLLFDSFTFDQKQSFFDRSDIPEHDKIVYISATSFKDFYICASGKENLYYCIYGLHVPKTFENQAVFTREVNQILDGLQFGTEDSIIPGNNLLGGTLPGWTVIIGSIAAAAAVVAAVARIMKNRKTTKTSQKKDTKEQPKQYHYILNLNKEEFLLEPGGFETLVATVCRVDENGLTSQAHGASIQIDYNEPLLSVSPSSGTTTLSSSLSLKGVSSKAVIDITVRVRTEDQKFIEQPVRIKSGLKLVADSEFPREIINGHTYFEVFCRQQAGSKKGEWEFKPLYLFFASAVSDMGEPKPVAPPFSPVFTFTATPAFIIVDPPLYQGNLVWKSVIRLRPGYEPESQWLMNDGQIKIQVVASQSAV